MSLASAIASSSVANEKTGATGDMRFALLQSQKRGERRLIVHDRIVKAAQHGRALGRRRCPEAFKGHTGCRDRPPCLCPARIGHVADDIASGRIGHIDGVA